MKDLQPFVTRALICAELLWNPSSSLRVIERPRTDGQGGIPLYAPVGHMKKDTRKEKQNGWPTWWAPSTIPTPRSLPPTISTSLAYCVLVKPTPSEIHHSTHSSLSLNSHCTEWSQNTCENKISELTIHSNINNTHVLTVNCFENINHV